MMDEADAVAIEHVLWAAGQGMSPASVLDSVGIVMPGASWDDAQMGLRLRWRAMQDAPRPRPRPHLRLVVA